MYVTDNSNSKSLREHCSWMGDHKMRINEGIRIHRRHCVVIYGSESESECVRIKEARKHDLNGCL